jgi:hypothetical protein
MSRTLKAVIAAIGVLFAFMLLSIAAIVFVGVGAYKFYDDHVKVAVPDYPAVKKYVWLDQNWKPEERAWFHHADQGTLTFHIPYEWFMALEQPVLALTAAGPFSDPAYLDRFGFIPGGADAGKQELPVGMARGDAMVDSTASPWKNPRAPHNVMARIGLTCAACHTGRFTYQQTEVLIDGGPALTDLGKFRTALALALLFTRYDPFRFDRFAKSIMGEGASEEERTELRGQLDKVLAQGKALADLDTSVATRSVVEGFGRLDALNRIGNEVFAVDLKYPGNYAALSAPVHFPRIWSASWFDWVQYNGSIEQPMVRNVGEALGVSSMVNLTSPRGGLYYSGVKVKTLFEMEQLLAGHPQPYETQSFNGLKSPKWPSDILPPIDQKLAAVGADLYKENCQECHLPPPGTKEFWESPKWLPPNAAGERYLEVELIDIKHIGTDPAQAVDMLNRRVDLRPELGISSESFGLALGEAVKKTVDYWYDDQTPMVPQAMREQMNGYRKNGIQAKPAYKVRPLNGIWATPPYLHNGSVPTLYALLSPVADRPRTFYIGRREYDPKEVGYVYSDKEEFPGGFRMDTTIRGNGNGGHEFNQGARVSGIIGRFLKPDERRALIEYLKTL